MSIKARSSPQTTWMENMVEKELIDSFDFDSFIEIGKILSRRCDSCPFLGRCLRIGKNSCYRRDFDTVDRMIAVENNRLEYEKICRREPYLKDFYWAGDMKRVLTLFFLIFFYSIVRTTLKIFFCMKWLGVTLETTPRIQRIRIEIHANREGILFITIMLIVVAIVFYLAGLASCGLIG